MKALDLVEPECPVDVVDRMLWRNAQRILQRHVVRLDGTCQWCGRRAPCSPRQLAKRAEAASRQPLHEPWAARNDITRLLPVLYGDRSGAADRSHSSGRNTGSFRHRAGVS